MDSLISLSDHDNIEAGISLHALDEMRKCPISIEWTIAFRQTFFRPGIHTHDGKKADLVLSFWYRCGVNPLEFW